MAHRLLRMKGRCGTSEEFEDLIEKMLGAEKKRLARNILGQMDLGHVDHFVP